jgi:hypothetical protein
LLSFFCASLSPPVARPYNARILKGISMKLIASGAILALAFCANNAEAVGTLIPATHARDMVYDPARDLVYITNGTQVLRYSVSGGNFLTPITLGGKLFGIDLSPDGNTIAVADDSSTKTTGSSSYSTIHVDLVNADTLVDVKSKTTADYSVSGTDMVAYSADGSLLVTEREDCCSGAEPLLERLPNGAWQHIGNDQGSDLMVSTGTALSASGDGKVIGFEEPWDSPGSWGTYAPATHTLYFNLTQSNPSFFGIAVNDKNTQTIVYSGKADVYDQNHQFVTSIGGTGLDRPAGVAYHPVKALAYLPWYDTSEVRVYDMSTFQLKTTYKFVNTFPSTNAFNSVRTRLSPDGSLLMVAVDGGVRIFRMYAPLAAKNVSALTAPGQAVQITAAGSLGTTPKLISYKVPVKPTHGVASVSGNVITYVPASGFSGTDIFNYEAHYGRAVATASISVAVQKMSAIAATDDVAIADGNTPVFVPVLANDNNPGGRSLRIIVVSQPLQGLAAIQGNGILYTPPSAGTGTQTFQYTVSDGNGRTSKATVKIRLTNPH